MNTSPALPIVQRPHPGGRKGAMLSLDEVARRAWKSRTSPKLRAWATQQLQAAGYPQDLRGQVQALVSAFRRKAGAYVPDPTMVEFMASPEATLCLDEHGLCLAGYDCDDAAITCMALCLSVGVPHVWAVGASYKDPNVPTHVYFAFADEQGEKVRCDPTTALPVGQVHEAVREWWVDPSKGVDASALAGGEFVGIGRLPSRARARLDGFGDLSFGGRRVVGLGSTWPAEVYDYRRIWDPYMVATVGALRQCADAVQLRSDTVALSDPTTSRTLKLYADTARGNADFLATEWNAYHDWTEWQVMGQASAILLFFQRTVLQAGGYAASSGKDCPGIAFPAPVPLESQNAVIAAIENAKIVTVGSLQLLGIGAGGALQAVGDAVHAWGHAAQQLVNTVASPWPWIAVTAAAGAFIAYEVWPKRSRAA